MTKKTFILDTNVILNDYNCIKGFDDNDIIIPTIVLEELDSIKIRNNTVGQTARTFIRRLDKMINKKSYAQIKKGILIGKNKGKLFILKSDDLPLKTILKNFRKESADNVLLSITQVLLTQKKFSNLILVTMDINLRIKAKAIGLNVEDYKNSKIANVKTLYNNSMERWDKKEEIYLKNNYKNKSNKELSKDLKRSIKSIATKAHKLNLIKDELFVKNNLKTSLIKRTKENNRDLTFSLLKKIAKKYKTRGEFQKADPSAYKTARCKNIIDDVCSHMVSQCYSTPQLMLKYFFENILKEKVSYNNRKTIKPYELDIYIKKYKFAIEYNGKKWHKNNQNDKIKKDLCKSNGITLLVIPERDRHYERDIKNQLIENIDLINDNLNLNISKAFIKSFDFNNCINDSIFNMDDLKKLISKYKYLKEFKEKELKTYRKILRIKRKDLLNPLIKKRKSYNNDDIIKKSKKYIYLSDFIKNETNMYNQVMNNNKQHLISKLIKGQKLISIADEEILSQLNKKEYVNLTSFYKDNQDISYFIKSRKKENIKNKLVIYFDNKKLNKRLSDLKKKIQQFKYHKDFYNKYPSDYKYIKKYKLDYLLENLIKR